jgi:hypothetical protein
MKYMLMLFQDRAFDEKWDAMGPDERAAVYARFTEFDQRVAEIGGKVIGGNELGLIHTATTIRRPVLDVTTYGDEVVVTDGPFAEVAEHLGGYIEIEARDLDHAIEIAKLAPSGTTEIRPIVEAQG